MPTLLDTAEFVAAKDALATTLEHAEQARQSRLKFLHDALNRTEDELERAKKQALELPTDIARYRAEIARLEATTGGDILREAMGAPQPEAQPPSEAMGPTQPQPGAPPPTSTEEPFVPGLPPEALRKVWPEWEAHERTVVRFVGDQCETNNGTEDIGEPSEWIDIKLRPHGATRAHVEALAQQAQTPKPHACPRCDEGMRALERIALATGLEGAVPPQSAVVVSTATFALGADDFQDFVRLAHSAQRRAECHKPSA